MLNVDMHVFTFEGIFQTNMNKALFTIYYW